MDSHPEKRMFCCASATAADPVHREGSAAAGINRRRFIKRAAAVGGLVGLSGIQAAESAAGEPDQSGPVGDGKGIHPGRVVWVHDPLAINWQGPGDGHWYEADHISQSRIDEMLSRAICDLAGQPTAVKAWDRFFRYRNNARGRGDIGYKSGEKIAIKPNWVGMYFQAQVVDPETYTLVKSQDYMNTAPQMIIGLLRQLVEAGVKQADISICDTLAYLAHQYYDLLHGEFPNVQYGDYGGKFGRLQAKPSSTPLYWSCRPQGKTPDYLSTCFAEADYLVNFANLKAHTDAGVTLCGKNHFGSLVRWPLQQGYHDLHRNAFVKQTKQYREKVDLMGHAHLGGKTVLYLIDGLLSGKHPIDPAPRKWISQPFDGRWTCSLFSSQDPVAIDSVGLDFLRAEWDDYPSQPWVDDYLHEAALAGNPPSGTFYDPDHATPTTRLASLGVHEHWNNAIEKKYSRNLGTGKGIELLAVDRSP